MRNGRYELAPQPVQLLESLGLHLPSLSTLPFDCIADDLPGNPQHGQVIFTPRHRLADIIQSDHPPQLTPHKHGHQHERLDILAFHQRFFGRGLPGHLRDIGHMDHFTAMHLAQPPLVGFTGHILETILLGNNAFGTPFVRIVNYGASRSEKE